MRDGFIKVAAASVKTKVADPTYNRDKVLEVIQKAKKKNGRGDLRMPSDASAALWINEMDELNQLLQSEAETE